NSVDFITAGQSFHWFEGERVHIEFARILRPGGWVVLVWNGFRVNTSPVNQAYQELVLRYGTDYTEVTRELDDREFDSFFVVNKRGSAKFLFEQLFDYPSFEGRLLSSSFIPEPSHPHYESMLRDLHNIFETHEKDGKIVFAYETQMYYGQLAAP